MQLGAPFQIMPNGKFGLKHDAPGQQNNFGGNSNEQPIPKLFCGTEYCVCIMFISVPHQEVTELQPHS